MGLVESGHNVKLELEPLSREVIGAAIAVHRELGPGLLESAYQTCLAFELKSRGLAIEREVALPVTYRGVRLDCGYRIDLVIERQIIVEIKSVESLQRIHEAQMLTYLRLAKLPVGLLINFHVPVLKDGIKRLALTHHTN